MRGIQKLLVTLLLIVAPVFYCLPAKAITQEGTLVNITSPTTDAVVSGTQTIRGTAPADITIVILIDGSYAGMADSDSNGNWSFATDLANGTHKIKAVWIKNAYVFVSNILDHDISVISTINDEYITDFSIDQTASLQDVVLTPDHSKAYILDVNPGNPGAVWTVDVGSYYVPNDPLNDNGEYPFAAAPSLDGSKIYVVNRTSKDLSVINTSDNSVDGPFALDSLRRGCSSESCEPLDIAVSPVDGTTAYIANYGDQNVLVYDLINKSITDRIVTACPPSSLAFTPDGQFAYVTESCLNGTKIVEVISPATNMVLTQITVGTSVMLPQSIAATPDSKKVLLADYDNNKVWVINTSDNSVGEPIEVGNGPTAVAINDDGTKAYITNSISNTISVINLSDMSVIKNINVGNSPNGLGILEDIYFSHEITLHKIASIPSQNTYTPNNTINPINSLGNLDSENGNPTTVQNQNTPVNNDTNRQNNTNDYTPLASNSVTKKHSYYWLWGGISLLILSIIYVIYKSLKRLSKE